MYEKKNIFVQIIATVYLSVLQILYNTVPGLGGNCWSSCKVSTSSEDIEFTSLSVAFDITLDL